MRLQIGVNDLLGHVKPLVHGQLRLELGQHILLDRDSLVGLMIADHGANVVVAHVDFIGKLEVDRGDAEVGRLLCALVDLVALGILHLKR